MRQLVLVFIGEGTYCPQHGKKPRGVAEKNKYWALTELGQNTLMKLRAIKKDLAASTASRFTAPVRERVRILGSGTQVLHGSSRARSIHELCPLLLDADDDVRCKQSGCTPHGMACSGQLAPANQT